MCTTRSDATILSTHFPSFRHNVPCMYFVELYDGGRVQKLNEGTGEDAVEDAVSSSTYSRIGEMIRILLPCFSRP